MGRTLRWNERIQTRCLVLRLGLLASDYPNFMVARRTRRGQATQGKGAGREVSKWVESRKGKEARSLRPLS